MQFHRNSLRGSSFEREALSFCKWQHCRKGKLIEKINFFIRVKSERLERNNMNQALKYCRVRKVKNPNRAHLDDAGIDFYVPEDLTLDVMKEKIAVTGCDIAMSIGDDGLVKSFKLKPNESVLIPSGIKVKVPEGYMLQYTNKSGIASKRGLLVGSNVVDCGYMGECHINLHNVSKFEQTINAGDKIVQGILIPVGLGECLEAKDEADLFGSEKSSRLDGGFGSTGTK